ncbi:FCD domain-containing protein [Octadecabacter sp. CECT 8868]|uniref:FadR/GntR family transcriptional regulator n=1 Tax=Octadecabacter algicola TaxID=2909342 RepID=UPI001F1BDEBE|nr:FCD domain-containing protein [Octadecabacter algicola]MCF2905568.1 FCD domain-containing protein [Octadecabacter algicola]
MRSWVSGSGLAKGARLPSERALCSELGVSRADLRKALLVLEAEGILDRHVGRGTYLSKTVRQTRNGAGLDRAIAELAESTGPLDAMNARLLLEPEIAQLAAMHATPSQLRELNRLSASMREATNWKAYENLDRDFHELIAAASGNTLLEALHKMLNGVRLIVVWRRLDTSDLGPDTSYHSFDEHDAIVTALEARDAVAAGSAMRRHLETTRAMMTHSANS